MKVFCRNKLIALSKSQALIQVAVDAVVFGYSKQTGVSVLLIKRKYPPYKDRWALPGGFIQENESPEYAVRRELEEESGVKLQYLEQLYTFGEPDRDPRGRIISIAYMALVKSSLYQQLKANTDADDAGWFDVKNLPQLAFDHKIIVQTALERIRSKIRYQPIGFELLNEKFSFADLEHLYRALLDREIDRRNFKKKILSLGILEETEELAKSEGAGRPSHVYKFNKKRYQQLLEEGMSFEV